MKKKKSTIKELPTQSNGCCTPTTNAKEKETPCCEQPEDSSPCCDKTESKEVNSQKTACC